MIIYASDFDVKGSGYARIGTRLCAELVNNSEIGVIALGLGYNGEEHPHPYSIVPVPAVSHIVPMIKQLIAYGAPVEAVVVALDIPLQEAILQALGPDFEIPYIGLFPLEAGPLCQPWAMMMAQMDERLIMSQFGQDELTKAGIESTFMPIGIDDPDVWRPPTPDERAGIREALGIASDTFMVLTVADNQERKNLSRAAEIFSKFSVRIDDHAENGFATKKTEIRDTAWHVVTRLNSPVGWRLDDLAMRLGIMERTAFHNRGLTTDQLWALYAAADCFLLTSKAEGLAIPVMEAMACRLPVAATSVCAMAEHMDHGRRGWGIESEYQYTDPFGNGLRYWAAVDEGVKALESIRVGKNSREMGFVLDDAQNYIAERTWEAAGKILFDAIDRVAKQKGTRIENGETKTPILIAS